MDCYEYLTDEETPCSDHRRVIEQANFTYSLLGKPFEKQSNAIEEQREKQVKSLQNRPKINQSLLCFQKIF